MIECGLGLSISNQPFNGQQTQIEKQEGSIFFINLRGNVKQNIDYWSY
jgi:hypothetical protein